MFDKKVNLIAVMLLVVIGIALTCTMVASVETTPFKTDFMEGSFVGKVSLENDSEYYMSSYYDKQHDITYNISTVDDSVSLMEIYELQGVTNPDKRTFNGNDWNIYFTQAVPGNDTSNTEETMNIIICQSQDEKQGYLIYAIFGADSDVDSTGDSQGKSYTDYVEPLLKSIKLKETKKVPKINDEFGLTEEEFQEQMDMIHDYKNGDTSALEGDSSSSSSSSSSGQTYWASSNSNKFHYPGCEWAQKISSKNKVVFNSREEALNSGYRPCEVCGP